MSCHLHRFEPRERPEHGGPRRPHRTTRWVGLAILTLCGLATLASPAAAVDPTTRIIDTAMQSEVNAISASGRYVVVYSGNTWRFDRVTDALQLVSVDQEGISLRGSTAVISDDGTCVAFKGDHESGRLTVYVRDLAAGTVEIASVASDGTLGNLDSLPSALSGDGRFVAFYSDATNLVSGDTNGTTDVFVHDRSTGVTERVSRRTNGTQANGSSGDADISADGRYVTFVSSATNLVKNDTNQRPDVFVHDRSTGRTTRVSIDPDGRQFSGYSTGGSISANGRLVAFSTQTMVSGASRSDVYVRDRDTGKTRLVSVNSTGLRANKGSCCPSISPDGRFVVFLSSATNLVPLDRNRTVDTFIRDRVAGTTQLVSARPDGTTGPNVGPDDCMRVASVSRGGRWVAFMSCAPNIVADDQNGTENDVFLRGPLR